MLDHCFNLPFHLPILLGFFFLGAQSTCLIAIAFVLTIFSLYFSVFLMLNLCFYLSCAEESFIKTFQKFEGVVN
jgi:hypothetical protein